MSGMLLGRRVVQAELPRGVRAVGYNTNERGVDEESAVVLFENGWSVLWREMREPTGLATLAGYGGA